MTVDKLSALTASKHDLKISYSHCIYQKIKAGSKSIGCRLFMVMLDYLSWYFAFSMVTYLGDLYSMTRTIFWHVEDSSNHMLFDDFLFNFVAPLWETYQYLINTDLQCYVRELEFRDGARYSRAKSEL